MRSVFKSKNGKDQIIQYYENLLKHWQVETNSSYVTTSFGKTFIIESGINNKKTIILIHGSSSNSAIWQNEFESWSKEYHVIAVDIPGECGKSDETRIPYNDTQFSKWLNEIFHSLSIQNATIIGNSLGGWISIEFAINFPQKVNKLILIAPGGLVPIKGSMLFWLIVTSFLGKKGFKVINKKVYGSLDIDLKVLKYAQIINTYFNPRTDALPLFEIKQLGQIKSSVLYIAGENDCFYNTAKAHAKLSLCVKKYSGKIIPNNGHVVYNQHQFIKSFFI